MSHCYRQMIHFEILSIKFLLLPSESATFHSGSMNSFFDWETFHDHWNFITFFPISQQSQNRLFSNFYPSFVGSQSLFNFDTTYNFLWVYAIGDQVYCLQRILVPIKFGSFSSFKNTFLRNQKADRIGTWKFVISDTFYISLVNFIHWLLGFFVSEFQNPKWGFICTPLPQNEWAKILELQGQYLWNQKVIKQKKWAPGSEGTRVSINVVDNRWNYWKMLEKTIEYED